MTASVRFVIGAALAILLSALFPVEVYAQKVAIVHGDIPLRADAVKAKLVTAGGWSGVGFSQRSSSSVRMPCSTSSTPR